MLTWVLGMVPPLAAQRSPPFADKTIPLEDGVDGRMEEWGFEKTGRRAYRFVTDDAKQIAYLLDAIELVVLP